MEWRYVVDLVYFRKDCRLALAFILGNTGRLVFFALSVLMPFDDVVMGFVFVFAG